MHQRQRRHHAFILQIQVIRAHFLGQQHALVNQGARGQRRNVELRTIIQFQRAHGMFDTFANDEQFALECVLVGQVSATTDEHLTHDRLDGLRGGGDIAVVARHIAPAQAVLAFFMDDAGDGGFAGDATVAGLRQKDRAAGVFADCRQCDCQPRRFLTQERVGQLNQYAGAIPQFRVVTGGAAMGQILQNLQTLTHDIVAFFTFDMCHETDSARIMFMRWIV